MQNDSGEKLLKRLTIMNVFTVENPIMNTILPLTMCIPDAMGVLTYLVTVSLPVDNVTEVKEVNTG
tara:strand:+ start:134 stop:331 length:198 start_codon:yes stop_codon:yes gene_type:complete